MNFLPIAHMEMRATARHPMTYYSRCLAALVAISTGMGFVFAGFAKMMSATSAGQAVFGVLTVCAYVLVAVQATLLTCDCVSREKRDGTLGLLFLASLNGFDIVTGKLAAQACLSLSCLVATFPAFGFCVVLGGVGLGDFVTVALGLLNTLFFFAALGILISSCVRQERTAAAWGGLALLVLGIVLPVLSGIFNRPYLTVLIPAGAVMEALDPAAKTGAAPNATLFLLVSHALGWLFIGAASYLVPRFKTHEPNFAPTGPSTAIRRKDVSSDVPPPWLMEPAKPFLTMAILVMISAVFLGAARFGPSWMTMQAVVITILLLHGVLKFQAASQAGRVLAGKRRSGELELLLTTPYDEDEIVRACLLGVKRSLIWPTLFALGVDLALLIFGWWKAGLEEGAVWAVAVVAEVFWLLINLYGLSWLGLYLGLRLANPAKAAGQAIFYVVLLPWVLLVLLALLGVVMLHGHRIGPDFAAPCVVVFVISLVLCNSFFTGWAINELRDRFRALASRA